DVPRTWAALGPGLDDLLHTPLPTIPDLASLAEASQSPADAPDTVFVLADCEPSGGVDIDEVLERWSADERFAAVRLVVVTCGAVAARAGETVRDPAGAGVRARVASVRARHPELRIALLDVPWPTWVEGEQSLPSLGRAELGWAEPALVAGEPDIAVRGHEILAPRLQQADAQVLAAIPEDGWTLQVSDPGVPESLAWVPGPTAGATGSAEPAAGRPAASELAPGEVRVEVRAVGLNFHDIVVALGTDDDAARMGVGIEGSGTVVEVGTAVGDLKSGDRVMGLFPGGAGARVVVDRRLLTEMPHGWSFAEAAAFPMAHLAAHHALRDVAGVRGGE
uniref:alcohol dehydrogenase catalytic domain-containing protein n=1 Tax=Catenulispora rubra TaxID=280293 RepID=UPI001892040B